MICLFGTAKIVFNDWENLWVSFPQRFSDFSFAFSLNGAPTKRMWWAKKKESWIHFITVIFFSFFCFYVQFCLRWRTDASLFIFFCFSIRWIYSRIAYDCLFAFIVNVHESKCMSFSRHGKTNIYHLFS